MSGHGRSQALPRPPSPPPGTPNDGGEGTKVRMAFEREPAEWLSNPVRAIPLLLEIRERKVWGRTGFLFLAIRIVSNCSEWEIADLACAGNADVVHCERQLGAFSNHRQSFDTAGCPWHFHIRGHRAWQSRLQHLRCCRGSSRLKSSNLLPVRRPCFDANPLPRSRDVGRRSLRGILQDYRKAREGQQRASSTYQTHCPKGWTNTI